MQPWASTLTSLVWFLHLQKGGNNNIYHCRFIVKNKHVTLWKVLVQSLADGQCYINVCCCLLLLSVKGSGSFPGLLSGQCKGLLSDSHLSLCFPIIVPTAASTLLLGGDEQPSRESISLGVPPGPVPFLASGNLGQLLALSKWLLSARWVHTSWGCVVGSK